MAIGNKTAKCEKYMENFLLRPCINWEKMFSKCISKKGYVSKIYKELLKLNSKTKKKSKHFEQTFHQRYVDCMTNKCKNTLNRNKLLEKFKLKLH